MLRNQFNSVELIVKGDFEIVADRSLIVSIGFNLMTNSLAAIRERQPQERWIRWTLDSRNRTAVCEDSAGGFEPDCLSSIQETKPFSGFHGGTGLGIQLVRECAARLGGGVQFSNGRNGAKVSLFFPSFNPASEQKKIFAPGWLALTTHPGASAHHFVAVRFKVKSNVSLMILSAVSDLKMLPEPY
ncbi:MAG: sensor histidine kinase [Calothrix sp. SM1_5_4]|nr:sensor histidine kinase [Calothrix sp. SM1_5_4]